MLQARLCRSSLTGWPCSMSYFSSTYITSLKIKLAIPIAGKNPCQHGKCQCQVCGCVSMCVCVYVHVFSFMFQDSKMLQQIISKRLPTLRFTMFLTSARRSCSSHLSFQSGILNELAQCQKINANLASVTSLRSSVGTGSC